MGHAQRKEFPYSAPSDALIAFSFLSFERSIFKKEITERLASLGFFVPIEGYTKYAQMEPLGVVLKTSRTREFTICKSINAVGDAHSGPFPTFLFLVVMWFLSACRS